MRIIFMGNPIFAIPSLKGIIDSKHEVLAVVTNPPKEMGRGKKLRGTTIDQVARELNLPLIQPDSLKNQKFIEQLVAYSPDLFVLVAFRILPKILLPIPKRGSVNLHASLLPAYRGAAPIQWALINGEKQTGISTFLIESKVDTGDILMQSTVPIAINDNYGTLSEKLSHLGADLLLETLNRLETGKITPVPQDHSKATGAPKITKENCIINWSESARKVHNLICGLAPTPGAFTTFKGKRIKIFQTRIVESGKTQLPPGTVLQRSKNTLIIKAGSGGLAILSLQREGKRPMNIHDFLLGSDIEKGDFLGIDV